mmetsp:Transcript_88658/g.185284  ORF Transcript_88658/g.185284 Transcript_88658/m.185284 type:complete len:222 (+) Transcript_88658:888-1553(+)
MLQPCVVHDTCIADVDVDGPQSFCAGVHEVFNRLAVRDVHLAGVVLRSAACLAVHVSADGLEFIQPAATNAHASTCQAEPPRDGLPDARRGSCHDSHLAEQGAAQSIGGHLHEACDLPRPDVLLHGARRDQREHQAVSSALRLEVGVVASCHLLHIALGGRSTPRNGVSELLQSGAVAVADSATPLLKGARLNVVTLGSRHVDVLVNGEAVGEVGDVIGVS